MHLQSKQSISSDNSPNVTQVLRAGKCGIMVKGHRKKVWRWRGLWGPGGTPQNGNPQEMGWIHVGCSYLGTQLAA